MIKVSVVISICDNRYNLFKRSLDTWANQTLPKDNFELIIVDDSFRDDIFSLCRDYNLNFQLIRIDNSLCDLPVTTFIPVLSNNIGMRKARGEVIVITGPETLQHKKNLENACTMTSRSECAYGMVYMSNQKFVDIIDKNWEILKNYDVKELLSIKGSCVDCLTCPPHPPAYWFLTTVAKKHVENINGVDERFAQGLCGEDDDFANRMKMSGITPVFDHSIIGIHQDHKLLDKDNHQKITRNKKEGQKLKQKNLKLVRRNLQEKVTKVNLAHKWGDEKVITFHEII